MRETLEKYTLERPAEEESCARVFVMPGNLFTNGKEEGESEIPGFLNHCMLNSVYTRTNKVHIVGTKMQCDCLSLVYKDCITGSDHNEFYYSDDVNHTNVQYLLKTHFL